MIPLLRSFRRFDRVIRPVLVSRLVFLLVFFLCARAPFSSFFIGPKKNQNPKFAYLSLQVLLLSICHITLLLSFNRRLYWILKCTPFHLHPLLLRRDILLPLLRKEEVLRWWDRILFPRAIRSPPIKLFKRTLLQFVRPKEVHLLWSWERKTMDSKFRISLKISWNRPIPPSPLRDG